jgi:predicted RNA-binding protein with PUA-like domain
MAYWLLKTEPDCYNWDQLRADGKTVWDGIANALALKNLRTAVKGDLALIYHTGDQRSAVGIAKITSAPYPDPQQDDDRLTVVELKPLRALRHPVSLDQIKADPAFAGWDLLRISRLGVVPVPPKMWDRIQELSEMDR